jgi:hypothetical protein
MKTLALLTVAGCIIACDSTPTAPHALPAARRSSDAVLLNEKFQLEQANFNYCDGSLIAMEMNWQEVFAITFDAAGRGHFKEHINLQGQGSDAATGVNYVANDVGNEEDNFVPYYESTYVEHYNLIAKGNAPNADLYVTSHVTITPDGSVSSYHSDFRVRCQ